MSLYPEDRSRKGRSRSRSRDRRSKDEPAAEPPSSYADVREPSYIYPEDDLDDRYKGRNEAKASGALPYPEEGGMDSMLPGGQALYSYDSQQPTYKTASPTADRSSRDKVGGGLLPGAFPDDEPRVKGKGEEPRIYSAEPRDSTYESRRDDKYTSHRDEKYESRQEDKYEGRYEDKHGSRREDKHDTRREDKYDSRREDKPDSRREDKPESRREEEDNKFKFLPQKYSRWLSTGSSSQSSDHDNDKDKKARDDDDLAYGKPPVPKRPPPGSDDLAYGKTTAGKTTGAPASTSHALTPYGSNAPHDEHGAERRGGGDGRYDERRNETYEDRRRETYEDRDDKYDDRRTARFDDDPYDERRYGEYEDRRNDKYDDRRDDPRDERRASKYADRHDSPDRRRPVDDYDRRRYESSDEGRPTAEGRSSRRRGDSILKDPQSSSANVLTVEPGSRDRERSRDRRKEKSSSTRGSSDMLTVDSGRKRDKSKSRDKSRERSRDHRRDKSPAPDMLSVEPGRRDRSRSRDGRGSSSLSVDTGRVAGMSLAMAPGSPLLESYYGTYQDCSPMPSPLLLATQNPGDDARGLEPLSPLSSDFEGDGKKRNRRARFHDPEDITSQLAQALRGSRRPDTGPLIDILPSLTHEQVMELRAEYKRIVKTGAERKGVNVAKHIRARLKDEDPLLMKACYAVALGMWESEAYWANFWYQGDKTRRELLIESLMGRTNDEIRAIKDAFSDKKYDNSLTKCMKTELKEDKFKKAVLMVLEERRMDEYDGYGRQLPLDSQLISHDVSELRRAVRSDKGGETAMIGIVVQRSESHLRAVLQEYELNYHSNFARDALKKSGNLVGELLAHILNGVINRPVRDALLLHHAITGSRKDGLRRELLISRLVRYHWDPPHMRAVKQAYRERYGKGLSEAVRESTSGEWGLFCRELCIARTPDDVRRFEKVAVSVR
ncbi:hypothetical protein BGZ61DRAFT_475211 [Ilyonectria robusta]|uniref:uncharacterized protein n=1 Tax=Ilyonectria robusta TaxID=1079257 RepID=UPI001E8D3FDE|nr:uncharacterized protein BGZ61DRAFT_475211 [Ilyonectria robusta]KAH8729620.1 hypothetical protein BGZ61DRAFT_475211 [Ilyonectria robusta]